MSCELKDVGPCFYRDVIFIDQTTEQLIKKIISRVIDNENNSQLQL